MFLLFSLISVVTSVPLNLAPPNYLVYPHNTGLYPGASLYNQVGAPLYQVQGYPQHGYPLVQGYPLQTYPSYPYNTGEVAQTRAFGGLAWSREAKADIKTSGAYTVSGTVSFFQGGLASILPFGSGSADSNYSIKVIGATNNKRYIFALATSCAGAGSLTLVTKELSVVSLGQGHYVIGSTSNFNTDGTEGRTTVIGRFLTITDDSGTVVGCSDAIALKA